MNTADYIVKKLEELGVNDFFGLPGDYNLDILYAIENNKNTHWVGCTNELNAGYAADGYARVRGYGALVTTYGVGELSAINAIAGSYAENVPVVHIVGIPSSKSIDKKELLHHNFQDVNYNAFSDAYKNVTAHVSFLNRDNAKIEIDKALKVLVKEKKPVYIAIPADIAKSEISDRYVSYDWESDKGALEKVVSKIVEKIKESKNPVILGDVLIKRFDSKIEYREFVDKSNIPVTNFLMGANLVDMDFKNYLGGYYADFRNPIVEKYVNETDCMIAVGPIYSDVNSFGFKLPYKINNHIAIYGTYTYVDGKKYSNIKMSDVLDNVTKQIEPKNIDIMKPNLGYKRCEAENKPISSEYIYPRIQEFLDENDIIIAETGTIPLGIATIKFPNNADIQYQALWGSIGWATPAVLGASIAKPHSRVILMTGEGAHQVSALEIGTMIKYGIKPVVIVINNKGYSIERLLSKDKNDAFNDIVQVNYSKFARIFEGDVWSTKVHTDDDFDKSLKVTQIMNKMCYIEVCIDSSDMPRLTSDVILSFKDKIPPFKQEVMSEEMSVSKVNETKNKSEIVQEEYMEDEEEEKPFYKDVKLVSDKNNFEYETVVHKESPLDLSEDDEEVEENE